MEDLRIRSAFYGPSGKEHDNFNFTNSCWTVPSTSFARRRAAAPLRPHAPTARPRPSSTVFDLIHMSQHNSNIASHKALSHSTEPTS